MEERTGRDTPASEDAPVETPQAVAADPGAPGEAVLVVHPDPDGLVRLAGGFYGLVALFAIGYAVFSGTIGTLLGEASPQWSHLLAAVGIGVVLVGLTRLGVRMWHAVEDAAREMAVMLGPLRLKHAVLLALASGIAEELLFRGALWTHLGLWGTTCLFGLVHVIPKRRLWGYPLFAAGAGLLLGLLRDGSQSVIAPMLAHVTINAVNLHWLGSRYERFARQHAAERVARRERSGR